MEVDVEKVKYDIDALLEDDVVDKKPATVLKKKVDDQDLGVKSTRKTFKNEGFKKRRYIDDSPSDEADDESDSEKEEIEFRRKQRRPLQDLSKKRLQPFEKERQILKQSLLEKDDKTKEIDKTIINQCDELMYFA
jgi:hypothetical protein